MSRSIEDLQPVSGVESWHCSGDVVWLSDQRHQCWKGDSCSRGTPLVSKGKKLYQSSYSWHREHLHLSPWQAELWFKPTSAVVRELLLKSSSSGEIKWLHPERDAKPVTLTWQAQMSCHLQTLWSGGLWQRLV